MAETAVVERHEPGVWEAPHRSLNRHLWLYAIDDEGCIVDWLEYGGSTGRTREEASATLWATLQHAIETSRRLPVPVENDLPRHRLALMR